MFEGYEYIIFLLFFVSGVFFVLGIINRRNDDAGLASTYFSVGLVLLVAACIVLFLALSVYKFHFTGEDE